MKKCWHSKNCFVCIFQPYSLPISVYFLLSRCKRSRTEFLLEREKEKERWRKKEGEREEKERKVESDVKRSNIVFIMTWVWIPDFRAFSSFFLSILFFLFPLFVFLSFSCDFITQEWTTSWKDYFRFLHSILFLIFVLLFSLSRCLNWHPWNEWKRVFVYAKDVLITIRDLKRKIEQSE